MKEIPLSKGKVTLVDDEDFDWLSQWNWYVSGRERELYAKGWVNGSSVIMHRLIMNTPDGLEVDHRDHNGLNNQRANLRNCTHTENARNRVACGKTGYLGVSVCNGHIVAHIFINKKETYLGTFKTYEEAALVYNKVALEYRGEFASLNIIQ